MITRMVMVLAVVVVYTAVAYLLGEATLELLVWGQDPLIQVQMIVQYGEEILLFEVTEWWIWVVWGLLFLGAITAPESKIWTLVAVAAMTLPGTLIISAMDFGIGLVGDFLGSAFLGGVLMMIPTLTVRSWYRRFFGSRA